MADKPVELKSLDDPDELSPKRNRRTSVGGYTLPKGSRSHFGSMLVGYQGPDELLFAARACRPGQIYRVDTRRPVASAGVLGAANGQGGKACGAGIEGRATLKSAKKFSATVKRL